MDGTWFIYYLFLMLIILYLPWKRRKRYAAKRIMKKGKINNSQRSAGKIMRELAERFIGKDVYINLLDGRADEHLDRILCRSKRPSAKLILMRLRLTTVKVLNSYDKT